MGVEVRGFNLDGAFPLELRERYVERTGGGAAPKRPDRMQAPVRVAVLTAVHGEVKLRVRTPPGRQKPAGRRIRRASGETRHPRGSTGPHRTHLPHSLARTPRDT